MVIMHKCRQLSVSICHADFLMNAEETMELAADKH